MSDQINMKEIINPVLTAAVVEALGDSKKLIEAIVEKALTQKKDYYDKQTTFEQATMNAIHSAARVAFDKWLREKEHDIQLAVFEALNREEGAVIKAIVEGFIDRLLRDSLIG